MRGAETQRTRSPRERMKSAVIQNNTKNHIFYKFTMLFDKLTTFFDK